MPSVAVHILKHLKDWEVHRVYGYSGDGTNGFLGAFEEVGRDPLFTQTRHEEMAAFMAWAHAKFTGEIGACMATSGTGAAHLINELYDTKLDHQAVTAVVDQQERRSVGAHHQQEIDLQVLFTDVGAAIVVVPQGVQEAKYQDPPRIGGTVYTSIGWNQPHAVPDDSLLYQAAEVFQ